MTDLAPRDLPAFDATTLCDAFQTTVRCDADHPALRVAGSSESLTWADCGLRVRELAGGLAALGVHAGDAVALMMSNRPEFHLFDLAVLHLGATPFSVYNTSSPQQINHILSNSGAQVAVTESTFLPVLDAARDLGAPLAEIVLIDDAVVPGTVPAAELPGTAPAGFNFDECWRSVRPSDLLTIIYTSGTTGPSKGVELTHANLLAAWGSLRDRLPARRRGRLLSYLPTAHIFDRLTGHYLAVLSGATVTSVAEPGAVLAALPEVRPTCFAAVPRIWEKLLDVARPSLESEPAFAAARHAIDIRRAGEPVPEQLRAECERAETELFGSLRTRLGLNKADWVVVGGAPCPEQVLIDWHAIGLPVQQGWAMSELAGTGAASSTAPRDIGTVGQVAAGLELRIAEDGELLVRGRPVMRGYRSDPARTAEALDPDGWLHTGDVGEIGPDGALRIVDRKKELIINSAGKNMSPLRIESALMSASPLIRHAVCIGDARPYNVALLLLDPGTESDMWLRDEVRTAVDRANATLSRVEQIKRFTVLANSWVPGGAELTPTLKLRRRAIEQRYHAEIAALYAQS